VSVRTVTVTTLSCKLLPQSSCYQRRWVRTVKVLRVTLHSQWRTTRRSATVISHFVTITATSICILGHIAKQMNERCMNERDNSTHRLPIFLTSTRYDVLLSAIGRLLLPALDVGTVYLLTSGLSRHLQHFVGS